MLPTLVPRNIQRLTVRSFSAHVPYRVSGYIWTYQLLDRIQNTLVAPEIPKTLKKRKAKAGDHECHSQLARNPGFAAYE